MSKSKYLVELLAKSRLIGNKIDIIPVDLRPTNEEEAYLFQDRLHRYLFEKKYGKVIGYKIGCTTKVMQEYLGISNPCVGGVYDINVNHIQGNYKFNKFISPGVECEIAVFLDKDLPPENYPYNRISVQEAVSDVMASIEIVDDRWVDYKSIDTLSLISDDFFASGCVLGERIKLDKLKLFTTHIIKKNISIKYYSSTNLSIFLHGKTFFTSTYKFPLNEFNGLYSVEYN